MSQPASIASANDFLTAVHHLCLSGAFPTPGVDHAENIDGDEIRVDLANGHHFYLRVEEEDDGERTDCEGCGESFNAEESGCEEHCLHCAGPDDGCRHCADDDDDQAGER